MSLDFLDRRMLYDLNYSSKMELCFPTKDEKFDYKRTIEFFGHQFGKEETKARFLVF